MSDYLNKVVIKGRIGKDPEVRTLPSGDSVANFSVATKSGSHVEWHPIVAYKHLADRAKAELGTGDVVFIEGESKTREMLTAEDKANNRKPRKIREIIADSVSLVSKANKATDPALPASESQGNNPGPVDEPSPQQPDSDIPAYI